MDGVGGSALAGVDGMLDEIYTGVGGGGQSANPMQAQADWEFRNTGDDCGPDALNTQFS